MSLEQAIADNTRALNELISVLGAFTTAASANAYARQKAIHDEPLQVVAAPVTASNEPEVPVAEQPVSVEPVEIKKQATSLVMTAISVSGRSAVLEVFQKYGKTKLTDIDEQHYPAIIEALRPLTVKAKESA